MRCVVQELNTSPAHLGCICWIHMKVGSFSRYQHFKFWKWSNVPKSSNMNAAGSFGYKASMQLKTISSGLYSVQFVSVKFESDWDRLHWFETIASDLAGKLRF